MSTVTATPAEVSGMTFEKTEQQLAIEEMVRKFAQEHIKLHIMEWDEAQTFPVETMKKLGEQGLAFGGDSRGDAI
ncbi:MAG: acyl-CoA dehydrogenase family protein, partial [Bacteroidota bacterium]